MGITELAAFLVPFLPHLLKLGEGATEKFTDTIARKAGDTAARKAEDIWAKLAPKVAAKETAQEAIADVAQNPDDLDCQAAFRRQLQKLLEADQDLAEAIAQIFQDSLGQAQTTQITQTVTGNQNQVIGQMSGGTVIGSVQGPSFNIQGGSPPVVPNTEAGVLQPPDWQPAAVPKSASPNPRQPQTPISVFFSYSHKDEELRDELAKHLSVLERNGVIASWHDRKIVPGQEWAGEIDEWMNAAQVILLLVSSDFIASDYCWNIEVKRAIERHAAGEARVVPVILRPTSWEAAPFGKLQALPKNAKPVTSWTNRDEAFLNIAQGIEAVVARFG